MSNVRGNKGESSSVMLTHSEVLALPLGTEVFYKDSKGKMRNAEVFEDSETMYSTRYRRIIVYGNKNNADDFYYVKIHPNVWGVKEDTNVFLLAEG